MIWNTFFYEPLYNALIGLINILPDNSLALAVIALTVIVKLILSPLSLKATKSQILQKQLEPKVAKIRKEVTDPQLQAAKLIELYKEHKTNPFSGCLLILIQLPIILALYTVFLRGIDLNPEAIYSFISYPETIGMTLAGIDLTVKSIALAIAAGAVQFVQIHFSPAMRDVKSDEVTVTDVETGEKVNDDPQARMQNMGKSMQKNMKVIMPVMIFAVAMAVPSAVALYWVVSSGFTAIQEQLIYRKIKKSSQS